MKTTIYNMGLIIISVENELYNNNYKESKTLMNTYRTLLQRFLSLPKFDSELSRYESTLTKQKEKLIEIHDKVQKNIGELVMNKEYKNADDLAEIANRIEYSFTNISGMLYRYKNELLKLSKFNG